MYSLSLLALAFASVASAAIIDPTTMRGPSHGSLGRPIRARAEVDAILEARDAADLYERSIAGLYEKPSFDWKSGQLPTISYGIGKREADLQERGIIGPAGGGRQPVGWKGIGKREVDLQERGIIGPAGGGRQPVGWKGIGKREADLQERGIIGPAGGGRQPVGWKGIRVAARSEEDLVAREIMDIMEARSILPPPKGSHMIWAGIGREE